MALPSVQPTDDRYARERAARHLAMRGIGDELVLAAMGTVPREFFLLSRWRILPMRIPRCAVASRNKTIAGLVWVPTHG
jgi:hypothetical protein